MQPICKFNSRQKSALQTYRESRKAPGLEICIKYHQNMYFTTIKQISLFAQKRDFSQWGILSIFWTFQAAGRAPSTSFLFIITNYEFYFLLFFIHYPQQFTQNINPSHSSKSPNITLISHPGTPFRSLPSSTPPRGTLFPDKNIPKCTSIPSPTCAPNSLNFS